MQKRLVLLTLVLALGSGSVAPGNAARKPREEQIVATILASIKGKEKLPAGEVFQNVQLLSKVPAERLLRIMSDSYSKSLGVSCDHCHVEGSWHSDEKRSKDATREMIELVTAINERMKTMKHLDSDTPTVNCNTCHRGSIFPALQGE